jgi:uncharacterized membrane protein
MLSYAYPKRFFGELANVVIVLALLLFMMKDFAGSMASFFHTPAFSVDLLAAIVIVLLSLAFIVSLVRLVKKILGKKR